jgi:hypothetical protein
VARGPLAGLAAARSCPPTAGWGLDVSRRGITVYASDVGGGEIPERWGVPPDVRVSMDLGDRPELYYSRAADIAPFWGGAAITSDDFGGGFGCTAGIPAYRGSRTFMLTAAHCGRPGGGWHNGDGSVFVGTVTDENVYHDVMLIEAPVDNRIYIGHQQTTTNARPRRSAGR